MDGPLWLIRSQRKKLLARPKSTAPATSRCARGCAPRLRRVIAAIATGNKETARTSYQEAVPLIDTLVTKKIVHRNKAARHKSRLAARIRQMQAKA
jgi:small subunit ribosomal protein S20